MNPQAAPKSHAILAAMALCLALQMTGFIMVLPLFALRFESFGAGVQALSLSSLAYALASTLSAPFMGMLADRFGRRPIILISLTAYVLAFSGFHLASSAVLFILLRGLAGLFTAGLVPAMTSIVGDLAPEGRRAQWIGIVIGGASAGWVIGPLVGGWLNDRFGYVVPFAAAIGLELAALLLALVLVPETRKPVAAPAGPRPSQVRGLPRLPALPAFYLLMLISFGVMFAWAFIEPEFMFYFYDDLGWSSSRLGLVMSFYGLACMLGEFGLGRLSDRLGRKPVLVLGLALFSAQFLGLVIFRDPFWLVISFIIAGLGNSLYDPALSANLLDITPPEHTGRVLGLRATAGSIGSMLGPALVVLFAPLVGPQQIFLAACSLVWLLMFASLFGLRSPRKRELSPHLPNAAVSQ
jgi:MFS family permease